MSTTITPPTALKTSPIKFTQPEAQRLEAAKVELARLNELLAQVVGIKTAISAVSSDFASGKINMREALGLIAASGDASARAELEGKLRRPVKVAIKATVASVADLIDKARQHHVAELAAKAASLEKNERATLDELGLSQDNFQPSDLLRGIREQHARAKTDAMQPATLDALNRLLCPTA